MKRISSDVERTGDNVKVSGLFRTKWKTPGSIKVVAEKSEIPVPSTIIEGDAKEVFDTMSALAEVAWDMGWRPDGLPIVLAHVIQNFKLPKPE